LLFEEPTTETAEAGHHDLQRLAAEVHLEYFAGAQRLPIQWGKKIGRKKRRSIRLGSYDGATQIIRIHPTLDTPLVPRFFIQSIIYHEYLHHVMGPRHNVRFHRREQKFRFHRESREWLKRNLPLLLGRQREARVPVHLRDMPLPPPNKPVQLSLFG
jgi:hypothetical protein